METTGRTFEVTRGDLVDIRREMTEFRSDIRGEIAQLRREFADLRAESFAARTRLIVFLFGFAGVCATALLVILGAIAVALLT